MDTSCKPCADFWQYVNGGWIAKNPIPADRSSWGTFNVLITANRERIRSILDAAATDRSAAPGSEPRKMADLYSSCLDTAAIEKRGLAPLKPVFDRIAAVEDPGGLNREFARLLAEDRPGPVSIGASQDRKDSSREIAVIAPAALSLPDRDYYFRDDEKSRQIRTEFRAHIEKMLTLAGDGREQAASEAKLILDFETLLARPMLTIVEKRNPENTYHPMDAEALRKLAPEVEWAQILSASGVPESASMNVTEPEYIRQLNGLVGVDSLEKWKTWLRWRYLSARASSLTRPIDEERFRFSETVLSGIPQQLQRWETCATVVDQQLSDILGKAYAEKYFPPEAKQRVSAIVENVRAALREQLENSTWMAAETKKNAIRKLNAIDVQIGYPNRWRDYSNVKIDRASYFENLEATRLWTYQRQIGKIGKPVSHDDWSLTVPTVNASSNQVELKLIFPAGYLQPPFFDPAAEDAANYGVIGEVVGHEMGHQFDDGGSRFDEKGTLRNWWTADDKARFESHTACVVDQFNTLDVGDGLHHNGKQVLGEALGDLGGLIAAYRAYHRSLNGREAAVIDGYTGDQRFFIAFARKWGTQRRPENIRLILNTDPHPIDRFRAIATLQNIPEFHKAFQCKPGDSMVRAPEYQCSLW
jgi:predicted metalloendopeptidase